MPVVTENPFAFTCDDEQLCGILHEPESPRTRGVVMLVGGPQYRVGSHRQFVLTARALAADGICVLRFDHRGAGDSEGVPRSFEELAADLDCAVTALLRAVPAVSEVVVWGLCDAASAAALFAWRNDRVTGVVLLNPWIRSEATLARTYLRHYYPKRLVSGGLWSNVLRGRFQLTRSLKSFLATTRAAVGPMDPAGGVDADSGPAEDRPLPLRMADRLGRFEGRVLFILSGEDLTAREFQNVAAADDAWKALLAEPRVGVQVLPGADHTFTAREHLDTAARWTSEWVRA